MKKFGAVVALAAFLGLGSAYAGEHETPTHDDFMDLTGGVLAGLDSAGKGSPVDRIEVHRDDGSVHTLVRDSNATIGVFHTADGCWARFCRANTDYFGAGVLSVYCQKVGYSTSPTSNHGVAVDSYTQSGGFLGHGPVIACTALNPSMQQSLCGNPKPTLPNC